MNNFNKLIIVSLVLLTSEVFASTDAEIAHLLRFVASTHCQYERNGTMHSGEQAVEHIKKKYAYFSDDIKTTEDFIQYSATKSKISGKYYKVYCGNDKPIKSRDWLLAELNTYRQNLN